MRREWIRRILIATTLAILMLLPLTFAINVTEERSSDESAEMQTSTTSSKTNSVEIDDYCRQEFERRYRKITPIGWNLIKCNDRYATYDVNFEELNLASMESRPRGAIYLDDSKRYLLNHGFRSPEDARSLYKKQSAYLYDIPKIQGFTFYSVDSDELLSLDDRVLGKNIRVISDDGNIFCLGSYPGLFECIWIKHGVQYWMGFEANQLFRILPYVKSIG